MQFTRSAQLLIRDLARSSSVGDSEFRRIVGIGNMYLAHEDAPEQDEYVVLLGVSIDEVPYKICRKLSQAD